MIDLEQVLARRQRRTRRACPQMIWPNRVLFCGAGIALLGSCGQSTAEVTRVEVWPDTIILAVGGEVSTAATAFDATFHEVIGRPIIWESSDSTIAAVTDSGFHAVNTGVAKITATIDGKQGHAVIHVVDREHLPSLAQDVQPIFSLRCATAGCHVSPNPPMGLNLAPGDAFATTVNIASEAVPALDRVTQYDPEVSWLLLLVERRGHDQSTDRVFRAHADVILSLPEIEIIRSWIRAGAKNN